MVQANCCKRLHHHSCDYAVKPE
uniref:Uncharacterized protein n=1 Tax=Anguilla anguilla TaxID=7936 RepID=A0A0E9VT95_ANGAN